MDKIARWITFPAIPWGDFRTYWLEIVNMIAPWNRIFPLTDLMTIFGLCIGFLVGLMILFTIAFIKSFIPFSGGK